MEKIKCIQIIKKLVHFNIWLKAETARDIQRELLLKAVTRQEGKRIIDYLKSIL